MRKHNALAGAGRAGGEDDRAHRIHVHMGGGVRVVAVLIHFPPVLRHPAVDEQAVRKLGRPRLSRLVEGDERAHAGQLGRHLQQRLLIRRGEENRVRLGEVEKIADLLSLQLPVQRDRHPAAADGGHIADHPLRPAFGKDRNPLAEQAVGGQCGAYGFRLVAERTVGHLPNLSVRVKIFVKRFIAEPHRAGGYKLLQICVFTVFFCRIYLFQSHHSLCFIPA